MVFVSEQGQGVLHLGIVQSAQFLAAELHLIRWLQWFLNQGNDAIIDDANEFSFNAIFNFLYAFFLNAADALGFDKDLIG